MQACNGTVFWTYNFCVNRRWFKRILFIPTKSSNSDLLLNFDAFRISREVNPVPAIANFTDLNQEVFLLAAYGNVEGLFYGCCCCTFVLFFVFFTVCLRSNNYWMTLSMVWRIMQIEERAIRRGRRCAEVNDNSLRVRDLRNSFYLRLNHWIMQF